jgi:hypothetical protein
MVVQVLQINVSDDEDVEEGARLRPSAKRLRPHPMLAPDGLPLRYFAYPKGSLQCKNGNHCSCTNQ